MTTHRPTTLLLLAALAACATRAAPVATIPIVRAEPAARAAPASALAPSRAPLPAGYVLVRRPGFSLGVPEVWHPLPNLPGSSVVMGSGPDVAHGLFVSVAISPFEGTLDDFFDLAAPSLATNRLAEVARTASHAAADAAVDVEYVRRGERTAHMQALLAESRRVGVLIICGGNDPVDEASRAACTAVMDSLRFGAGHAAPSSLRVLAGDGWRMEVPASWTDVAPNGMTRLLSVPGDRIGLALQITSPPAPVPFTSTLLARFQGQPGTQVINWHETVSRPDDHRTAFELVTRTEPVEVSELLRVFIHGDVAIAATCTRAGPLSADERAQCARMFDTLRGE